MKRKRGRPPGSKNKKTVAKEQAATSTAVAAAAGPSTGAATPGEPPVKRGRGRPPKVRRVPLRAAYTVPDLPSPSSGSLRTTRTRSLSRNASGGVPPRLSPPRRLQSPLTTETSPNQPTTPPRRRGGGRVRTRPSRLDAHPLHPFADLVLCGNYFPNLYAVSITTLVTTSSCSVPGSSLSRFRTVPYNPYLPAIVFSSPRFPFLLVVASALVQGSIVNLVMITAIYNSARRRMLSP